MLTSILLGSTYWVLALRRNYNTVGLQGLRETNEKEDAIKKYFCVEQPQITQV